jgi:hypothetical protein
MTVGPTIHVHIKGSVAVYTDDDPRLLGEPVTRLRMTSPLHMGDMPQALFNLKAHNDQRNKSAEP